MGFNASYRNKTEQEESDTQTSMINAITFFFFICQTFKQIPNTGTQSIQVN